MGRLSGKQLSSLLQDNDLQLGRRSIVNGLRDDDDEDSLYDNRVSMASEFDDEDDSMQVYVKEHHRTGSDTSQQQLRNQRKSMRRARAETKVSKTAVCTE